MKLLVDLLKLKRFATQEHRVVFVLIFRSAKQFYVTNMQEKSKMGKKSETNRQTFVIWDHPFKTSACLRGERVKNLPNLLTYSTKKVQTVGG